jgi:DNA (cytosine-5)-methyltransferase 1
LFSGAGGLSLGFKTAGFSVKLAVEREKGFCKSYKYNNPECICLNEDITNLSLKEILEDINSRHFKGEKIEGIIGGPPCQGFSSVGNRKLSDPRNSLIYFFIKWVEHFKPIFYAMENVSGILTMANGQIVKKIKTMYNDIGYSSQVKTLVAADYGVPQLRKRVFFIGTREGKSKSLKIPKTNSYLTGQRTLFDEKRLPEYLTVNDTLSDILEIEPFRNNNGDASFKEYTEPPKTDYQEYLRKDSDKLYDHSAPNHSQLVVDRISHVEQGKNHGSLPPEYRIKGGYPNIYGRLHLKRPADTITGNCGCVSAPGRFIHPTQNRALSVREAARLQSFPDDYRFFGSARDKYQQVGNSVPPLMAYAVARAVKKIV